MANAFKFSTHLTFIRCVKGARNLKQKTVQRTNNVGEQVSRSSSAACFKQIGCNHLLCAEL
jgi:hypothetical protein